MIAEVIQPQTPPAVPCDDDLDHRRAIVGGQPMIFHCHHYNTYLQRSIQEAEFIDSTPFLVGAAAEVAFAQCSELFVDGQSVAERQALAAEIFRWAGFGVVDFSGVSSTGGSVSCPSEHYGMAWKAKFGATDHAVGCFASGWIAGATAAIYDKPQGSYAVEQTACISEGDPASTFAVTEGKANYTVFEPAGVGPLSDHKPITPPDNNIDYDGILAALGGMDISGDADGIIPAFGVYLTRHYANYYNRISFSFEKEAYKVAGDMGIQVARPLLIEAGHVCAFNTFGGIMTSPEWDALIAPTIQSKTDEVHGIVACVNALGWGRWQVESVSSEGASFVIHDDYESVGYMAMYGEKPDHPVAHLAAGAAAGIMNLVYVGDVCNTRPDFDKALYHRLFKSDDVFHATVTACGCEGGVTRIEVKRG